MSSLKDCEYVENDRQYINLITGETKNKILPDEKYQSIRLKYNAADKSITAESVYDKTPLIDQLNVINQYLKHTKVQNMNIKHQICLQQIEVPLQSTSNIQIQKFVLNGTICDVSLELMNALYDFVTFTQTTLEYLKFDLMMPMRFGDSDDHNHDDEIVKLYNEILIIASKMPKLKILHPTLHESLGFMSSKESILSFPTCRSEISNQYFMNLKEIHIRTSSSSSKKFIDSLCSFLKLRGMNLNKLSFTNMGMPLDDNFGMKLLSFIAEYCCNLIEFKCNPELRSRYENEHARTEQYIINTIVNNNGMLQMIDLSYENLNDSSVCKILNGILKNEHMVISNVNSLMLNNAGLYSHEDKCNDVLRRYVKKQVKKTNRNDIFGDKSLLLLSDIISKFTDLKVFELDCFYDINEKSLSRFIYSLCDSNIGLEQLKIYNFKLHKPLFYESIIKLMNCGNILNQLVLLSFRHTLNMNDETKQKQHCNCGSNAVSNARKFVNAMLNSGFVMTQYYQDVIEILSTINVGISKEIINEIFGFINNRARDEKIRIDFIIKIVGFKFYSHKNCKFVEKCNTYYKSKYDKKNSIEFHISNNGN